MKNRRVRSQKVSTTNEEQVMASFDVYAEQAKRVNAMIIESGNTALETEFDTLVESVKVMTTDLINKYRKDLLVNNVISGLETDLSILKPTGMGSTYWNPMFNQQLEDRGYTEE